MHKDPRQRTNNDRSANPEDGFSKLGIGANKITHTKINRLPYNRKPKEVIVKICT